MRGRLYAGTSGFAYKQWKPGFYPPDLKNADMLRYYATRLSSVEINNTFYRMPSSKALEGWREQTPEGFALTLKAPQRITHVARLRDAGDVVAHFLGVAEAVAPRLGCILFQCPPNLRYDAERLAGFLATLPRNRHRFVMEFRHPSWDDPAVDAALAERGIARCAVDSEDGAAPMPSAAPGFVYLRLRKPGYEAAEVEEWSGRIRTVLDDGADAYVYFKHEDDPAGALDAERMRSLV